VYSVLFTLTTHGFVIKFMWYTYSDQYPCTENTSWPERTGHVLWRHAGSGVKNGNHA